MNSKTPTWTAGPWYYDARWSLIMGPRQQEVAAIHAAQDPKDGRAPIGTAQANARLIAAAPEMAEFVKSVFLWDLSKNIGRKKSAPLYPHIVEQSKALLAKLGI